MPEYGDQSQVDSQYKGMTPGQALGGGMTFDQLSKAFGQPQQYDPSMGGTKELYDAYQAEKRQDAMSPAFKDPNAPDYAGGYQTWLKYGGYLNNMTPPGQGPSLGDTMAQPVDTPRVTGLPPGGEFSHGFIPIDFSGIRDNQYRPPNPNQDGMTPGERFGGGLSFQQPVNKGDRGNLVDNGLVYNPNPNPFQGFPAPGQMPGGFKDNHQQKYLEPSPGNHLAFPDVIGRTLPIDPNLVGVQDMRHRPLIDPNAALRMPSIQPETGGPGASMPMPAPQPMPVSRPAPQPTQPIRPNRIQNRLRVAQPQTRPAPVPQPTKPVAPRRNRFRMRGF
jgi:hypothetical protein